MLMTRRLMRMKRSRENKRSKWNMRNRKSKKRKREGKPKWRGHLPPAGRKVVLPPPRSFPSMRMKWVRLRAVRP